MDDLCFDFTEGRLSFLCEEFGNGHFDALNDQLIGIDKAFAQLFCRPFANRAFAAAAHANQNKIGAFLQERGVDFGNAGILQMGIQKNFYGIFCLCNEHFQTACGTNPAFFRLQNKLGAQGVIDNIRNAFERGEAV